METIAFQAILSRAIQQDDTRRGLLRKQDGHKNNNITDNNKKQADGRFFSASPKTPDHFRHHQNQKTKKTHALIPNQRWEKTQAQRRLRPG